MLRNILIIFGWLIPLASIFQIGIQIYSGVQLRASGYERAPEIWVTVVQSVAYGVQSLALSPLCFFGAYMLGRNADLRA